jgi:hypothetical protein
MEWKEETGKGKRRGRRKKQGYKRWKRMHTVNVRRKCGKEVTRHISPQSDS